MLENRVTPLALRGITFWMAALVFLNRPLKGTFGKIRFWKTGTPARLPKFLDLKQICPMRSLVFRVNDRGITSAKRKRKLVGKTGGTVMFRLSMANGSIFRLAIFSWFFQSRLAFPNG